MGHLLLSWPVVTIWPQLIHPRVEVFLRTIWTRPVILEISCQHDLLVTPEYTMAFHQTQLLWIRAILSSLSMLTLAWLACSSDQRWGLRREEAQATRFKCRPHRRWWDLRVASASRGASIQTQASPPRFHNIQMETIWFENSSPKPMQVEIQSQSPIWLPARSFPSSSLPSLQTPPNRTIIVNLRRARTPSTSASEYRANYVTGRGTMIRMAVRRMRTTVALTDLRKMNYCVLSSILKTTLLVLAKPSKKKQAWSRALATLRIRLPMKDSALRRSRAVQNPRSARRP